MSSTGYPINWAQVAYDLKEAANWCCELCGSQYDSDAGPSLIVHHWDSNPSNCQASNLAVLCQRCHLKMHSRARFSSHFRYQLPLPLPFDLNLECPRL